MLTFTCSLTRRIGYTAQQIRPGLVRACAARALVEALFICEQTNVVRYVPFNKSTRSSARVFSASAATADIHAVQRSEQRAGGTTLRTCCKERQHLPAAASCTADCAAVPGRTRRSADEPPRGAGRRGGAAGKHATRHTVRIAALCFQRCSHADTRARLAHTALKHTRRCCSWRRCRPRCLQARAPSSSPVCLTTRLTQRTGYVEAVRHVVASLSESIAFEATGASEREVRRKADPAKADIERFLRDWKGSPLVAAEPSYAAVVGASTVRALFKRVC